MAWIDGLFTQYILTQTYPPSVGGQDGIFKNWVALGGKEFPIDRRVLRRVDPISVYLTLLITNFEGIGAKDLYYTKFGGTFYLYSKRRLASNVLRLVSNGATANVEDIFRYNICDRVLLTSLFYMHNKLKTKGKKINYPMLLAHSLLFEPNPNLVKNYLQKALKLGTQELVNYLENLYVYEDIGDDGERKREIFFNLMSYVISELNPLGNTTLQKSGVGSNSDLYSPRLSVISPGKYEDILLYIHQKEHEILLKNYVT